MYSLSYWLVLIGLAPILNHKFYSFVCICLDVPDFLSFVSSPEGIESLCSDLELDHTDVRILMLAW